MPSYRDLLKYAKTGIAAPGMSYRDMLRARAIGGGFPVSTIEGVPPLTFQSDGKPLISWTLWGNMTQSGTPTPSSPILPQACGDATNIFDNTITAGITDNTYINQSGQTAASNNYYLSYPIWLEPETVYTWSFYSGVLATHTNPSVAFYTADGTLISSASHDSNIKWFTFTTPANCAYIRGSVYKGNNQNTTMLLKGASSGDGKNTLEYQPYGYKIPFTTSQTVPVYLGQTVTTRRVRKLVLTGREDFSATATTGLYICRQFTTDTVYLRSVDNTVICTHYKGIEPVQSGADVPIGQTALLVTEESTNNYLYFRTSYDVYADFISYLAAQYAAGTPVCVWYVLETPETAIVNEPLCKIGDYADELHSADAGIIIPTAKGENVLTVDTDLPPSSVSITGHIK